MPRVLMYHDVVDRDLDPSGFTGGGPSRYKITSAAFRQHLDIFAAIAKPALVSSRAGALDAVEQAALMLTFDDGGVSAMQIADALEEHGWRGHFFITVDYIGRKGFLDATQIRELAQRGHITGTHSCSHPARMSKCTDSQLLDEWQRSIKILSSLIGQEIVTGSVPGGYYSHRVAESAAASGLIDLFTSEPTTRINIVNGTRVYGRYAIHGSTTTSSVAALASGSPVFLLKEAIVWQLKKVVKLVGGQTYLNMRRRILNYRGASPEAK